MEVQTAQKTEEIVIACNGTGAQEYALVLSDRRPTSVVIERGAEVRMTISGTGDLQMHAHENSDVRVRSLVVRGDGIREVTVGCNSALVWNDICFGRNVLKVHTTIALSGDGARATHNFVYVASETERKDFQTIIQHNASHTTSRMNIRGILGGKARAAYKGITRVDANTKGCDADQRHKSLLLTDTAEVTSDPVLEVHSEDVVCGHGASITRVDEERVFFLKTRGIKEEEANKMIVHGFIREHAKDFSDEEMRALYEYTDKLV